MKKLITLVIAGGMLTFYACGPSKEELAKREKAKQDSIAAVEAKAAEEAAARDKAKQDSIANAQATMEKAKQDSIAAAEANAAKTKPKADKPKKNVPKTVTAPGGRPGATKK